MTTQELQAWLFDRGFFAKGTTREKAVDGKFGNATREALRKAQTKLQQQGLYSKTVDGRAGNGTYDAIKAWNNGWKTFTGKRGRKFKMNIHEDGHFAQLRDWAAKQGISTISYNSAKFSVGDRDLVQQLRSATNDLLAGRKTTTPSSGQVDTYHGISFSDAIGIIGNKGTTKAGNGGASSFNASDLDNLVMRYAYDKYHGTAIDPAQWGIDYNYTPTRGGADITLKIDGKKWTPEQAAQIARGAGMSTYYYNGKKQNVNLFAGSAYKNLDDFNAQINSVQASKGLQAAQDMHNAELQRQYNTYGIDYNMLKNKTRFQWNSLFGAVPYGYNAQSLAAILHGSQAYQEAGQKGEVSSLGTSNYGYRFNPETGQGRFMYDNFDQWYQGRMLANSKYTRNGGISGSRAVTSTYALGFPVAQSMRAQLAPVGARPNKNSIDRSNYYDITDKQRGSAQMQAWVYNEVAKNPAAAYKYFQHIYGDRNGSGKVTRKHGTTFDLTEASRLAKAAGLSMYHLGTDSGKFYQSGAQGHDPYSNLKTFYENAFDETGALRTNFKYTENGYDHKYDGGNYTVFINNGKTAYAMDDWNIDLGGFGMGMNAGIDGKGFSSITRYNKLGGRLLIFCQSGGGLKGGRKRREKVDTTQCAEWSNSLLRDNDYDISGHAWSLNNADMLFNGYDGLERPAEFNPLTVQKYNRAASANIRKNFDSGTLDQSQPYVVNMYYNGSEKQERAFGEGKDVTGTHTGILTFENGRWMVTHNINGTIHQDDFVGLQSGRGKWGVTAVYAPRKATTFSKIKSGVRNLFGFKYGGIICKLD